jgi:3-oxoacyl-[acyl-carrier protein] reductase
MELKNVLVTSGAAEFGTAIGKTFAEAGYKAIITYNSSQEKVQKVMQSLAEGQHSIFHAPTTDAAKVELLKKFVPEKYVKLDVLVNNAGITISVKHDDLEGLSDEWIDKILKTNFRGGFAMCRSMKNLLQNLKELTSLIINMSSIAGIYGIGSNVAYCASKSAVDSMTRSLARALAPKIRVVSISLGFVEGEYTKSFDPLYLQNQKGNTPLNRFARGVNVAYAAIAVATQLTFSTENINTVDRGRLLK